MFADLVGFTTASEGRDAEETRELLTRYFEIARGVVERHGGTLEKFIGDAVMAVWGAPTAHEDDAERAVRAAMEIIAAVPSLGDEGHPIQARAGVLTGEAAVTIGATNQGLVAGDMVNTASRLQSAAAPGTVLVGETTYRAASNAISFEPAGEQPLKGKVSPHCRMAGNRRRGAARRIGPERAARAPVRGARRRAATAQGPLRRHGPGAQVAADQRHRAGRHRQVKDRLGVQEIPRWRGRHRLLARGTLTVIRRGDQLLGPGRDGAGPRQHRRGR